MKSKVRREYLTSQVCPRPESTSLSGTHELGLVLQTCRPSLNLLFGQKSKHKRFDKKELKPKLRLNTMFSKLFIEILVFPWIQWIAIQESLWIYCQVLHKADYALAQHSVLSIPQNRKLSFSDTFYVILDNSYINWFTKWLLRLILA